MNSPINMCRACLGKHMTHDFDRSVYICGDCYAEFTQEFGKWYNKGTDKAWRTQFLGEQIKAGKKNE